MIRILLAAVLLTICATAAPAQNFPAPQGAWAYAIAHPDPERARADAEFMRRFHQQQADSVECKRMHIGCPEVDTPPAPVRIKSTAEIQRDADAGWAYARNLHPSWGK